MLHSRLLLLAVAGVAAACSPFDPDLGDQPFLCGVEAPRCPDDYLCVHRAGGIDVCQPADAVLDAGGDGNLQCSGDLLESNETISSPTDVPVSAEEVHTFEAALCPASDLDVYRLVVDATGKNMRVELSYEPQHGQLAVDLLSATGTVIRTATPTSATGETLRADFFSVAQGTYFARVHSDGAINHYEIAFTVTSDTLPP